MLRTCVSPSGDDWERHLPAIEFAYNNTQQSSTGLSPFEVVHGRRPRVPLDTIAPSQRGTAPSPAANTYLTRIQELSVRIKVALQRSSARQKYHADKHRRESDIKAGDQVLVDSAHFGPRDHKLSPLYRGPFEVIERFGNTLLITLPRSLNQRHNRVNLDLARNSPRQLSLRQGQRRSSSSMWRRSWTCARQPLHLDAEDQSLGRLCASGEGRAGAIVPGPGTRQP